MIGIDFQIACKAYSEPEGSLHIEEVLSRAHKSAGGGKRKIGTLFDKSRNFAQDEPYEQMMLEFLAEEIMENIVDTVEYIKKWLNLLRFVLTAPEKKR